jgi:SET domain-containing protein
MLLFKTELRPSPIAGNGAFALESIPRGAIAGFLTYKVNIVTEEQYQAAQRAGDKLLIQSAVRWAGEYFLYNAALLDEDFINHSATPNLLYHCGILFALSDIWPGNELTVNYKYFLAVNDVYAFSDLDTRQTITGLDARQALLQSCQELAGLYDASEFGPPRHSDYEPLD